MSKFGGSVTTADDCDYHCLFSCANEKFGGKMASGKTLTKGKSGLRMLPNDDKDRSPFTIEEPPWQPDEKVCVFSFLACEFLVKRIRQ